MKGLTYRVNPIGWATCLLLKRLWPGCLRTGLNGLALRDLPAPPLPTDQWVRCRTVLGGICGSDLAILSQRQPPDSFLQAHATFPSVMGHENVAVVVEAGAAVDPSWVGRRVCVDPGLSCRVRQIDPPCRPCRDGRFGACENFSADGLGAARLPPGSCLGYCGPLGGAWGEGFVAHRSQLVAVPEGMSDELAVLTDPLACALHAVLRADLSAAERVLVYGGGVLGLGTVWALRATGFAGRVDAIARHAHQAAWARRLGADKVLALPRGRVGRFAAVAERVGGRVVRARLGGIALSGGYDVVFECVGSSASMEEAIKWTRSRGQTVLVGTGHGRGTDLTAVWFGELTVLGVSGRGVERFAGREIETYALAHELMTSRGEGLEGLLTHTFPLADWRKALATAMDKSAGSIKVAFCP